MKNEKNIYAYKLKTRRKNNISSEIGLNKKKYFFELKLKHMLVLKKVKILHLNLEELNARSDSFSLKLKSYKSFRNLLGYPSRGQRTKTNAKTKKKFKNKNT